MGDPGNCMDLKEEDPSNTGIPVLRRTGQMLC